MKIILSIFKLVSGSVTNPYLNLFTALTDATNNGNGYTNCFINIFLY